MACSGGLGINFGEAWEIEDIDEESQAEVLGLRPAIWLTHIQGELIVGKPGEFANTQENRQWLIYISIPLGPGPMSVHFRRLG